MIYYFTPYSSDKNLGKAYNDSMALLPNDDDWGVLMDGDTMFLQPQFGSIIENAIKIFPDTGMFTCLTNRVGNKEQLLKGFVDPEPDISVHRNNALHCQRVHRLTCVETKNIISGMVMIMQKKTWIRFPFKKGLLGVDNDLSRRILKAGLKIRIIKGLYVFHYYRLNEGRTYKKHLM